MSSFFPTLAVKFFFSDPTVEIRRLCGALIVTVPVAGMPVNTRYVKSANGKNIQKTVFE